MDHGKTVRRHEGHWGIEDEAPPEIEAVPEITTGSVEVSAGELACELCKTVSKDVLMAAVGFRPLGHDFNTKFNKTLERGSITEVFTRVSC